MWLGRFQSGDWLPLVFQRADTSSTAALPGNATVNAKIYNSSGSLTATVGMSIHKRHRFTGLLSGRWQVNAAVGRYMVIYEESTTRQVEHFEIVGGGSAGGAFMAMDSVEAPEGDYVLFEADSGFVYWARGPY